MTNYREILRLHSLGLNKTQIAQSVGCSRTTVIQVLNAAEEKGISYPLPEDLSDRKLSELLFPSDRAKPEYKMPDYEYVHREMQKSGVTLNLLWLEYCENCRTSGELPYQLTQFKKHYRDYAVKTNATMHLNHKPGEIMQVDWAGDTATVIDTDTGEEITAYVFVSSLPYSGYAYVEAFFSMNQECWIAAHVNAFRYYGGVTRILQCDNLKTGVISHGRNEITLNKAYNEMAEHYGTAILPCRVRAPKDKAMVEGTVGVISNYILGVLRNRQFFSLPELLTELAIARGNGTYPKVIQQYKKPALLILDEWLLYPLRETEARDLLEIAETRYKKASTIFCSQFDIPGWREKIGDPILADAICDRIVHDSYTIVINCKESMRKRKGVKENEV